MAAGLSTESPQICFEGRSDSGSFRQYSDFAFVCSIPTDVLHGVVADQLQISQKGKKC